ncbi:AAA family ATPase [Hymenobacter cavernae]|uniref:ATP-binding protein n=1 Tax=Hymenobacter cavernae TaxID=2044852 RepID=A0ABQ1U6A0_9BACT|nr:AAA family ATPase [Hymenobacter cavernae]GGF10511.1 ATP-binding protein [Hymenobacter cavernae]
MLKRLHVRNFTVFEDANFEFSEGLNVIVGTNGTGKSHVLKLGYAVEYVRDEVEANRARESNDDPSSEGRRLDWLSALRHYLGEVFLTGPVRNLIRRGAEKKGAKVAMSFEEVDRELDFEISDDWTVSESSMLSYKLPSGNGEVGIPIFIPPKEVLSFFPGFISLNNKYRLSFDITYANLFDALALPLLRQPPLFVEPIMNSLQTIMKGRISLENGQFYLYPKDGRPFEINLVAEGIRKFGMLAQLLNNGSLTPETTLYWDEPESNLNPALLKQLAALLVQLAAQGFQIILATHSLFLLKEFHILSREQPQAKVRYFGLTAKPGEATQVATADNLELLPDIVALDAELEQSDRFLDVLNQEDAGV